MQATEPSLTQRMTDKQPGHLNEHMKNTQSSTSESEWVLTFLLRRLSCNLHSVAVLARFAEHAVTCTVLDCATHTTVQAAILPR